MPAPAHLRSGSPVPAAARRPVGVGPATGGELADLLSNHEKTAKVLAIADRTGLGMRELYEVATREVAASELADGTRSSYKYHVGQWLEWCDRYGDDPAALDPEAVSLHLTAIAAVLTEDGDLARDATGQPLPGALRPVTVEARVAALNKFAEQIGAPRPGDHVKVTKVLRAIKRLWGTTPLEQKAALTIDLVRRLLAANDLISPETVRDHAVALLRRKGVTPGQMHTLDWERITFRRASVELDVNRPTRTPGTTTLIFETGPVPELCVVRALRALRDVSAGAGAVFLNGPRRMTRQGIDAAAKRLDYRCADERAFAAAMRAEFQLTRLQLRNRAMILTTWYAALRRSNAVNASWRHLALHGDKWALTLATTKGNPTGGRHPDVNWLVRSTHPDWPCVASAIEAWHAALTEMLGVDPLVERRSEPVFPAMDRHDNLKFNAYGRMSHLDGEVLNDLVQSLCERAGLTARLYGAHSLRSGFVTEALTDDKLSISEVQEVTHHKDVNVLMDYRRRVNAGKSNVFAKMWSTEPTP
jgi:integrase